MKIQTTKIRSFLNDGIWQLKLNEYPRWQRSFIKLLRIVILSIRDYTRKQLVLRATALTLFSLMSIVPVIAMIFGIATGFGLETYLTDQLNHAFANQPEILSNLLNYVHNLLGRSKGGLIAGLGFALLIWAVLQVLGNIENAFNSIWYVTVSRTWSRKFTDYLSIMLIAPLFIIVSGAANIFITTQLKNFALDIAFLGEIITDIIIISIKFIPYLSTIFSFFLLYLVLPNTRVKPRSALYAGIVAGIVFQIFQWAYIEFQYGVSSYNAIYGSFASIPLFITWLQFSWIIVLVGAEVSYSVQNIQDFEAEHQNKGISHKQRMLYSINILYHIAWRFKEAKNPLDLAEIAARIEIPIKLCKTLLQHMQKCDLIEQTFDRHKKETCYVPALDLSHLNIGYIIERLESIGATKVDMESNQAYGAIKFHYDKMEAAMFTSEYNKNILDLKEEL